VGTSPEVGPIGYGPEGPSRDNPFAGRPYAEETQRAIDQEVARLLREAESRATALLSEYRAMLDQVIELPLEHETIDGADLAALVGIPEHHGNQERPGHPGRWPWLPCRIPPAPARIDQGNPATLMTHERPRCRGALVDAASL
jgi:hypothetical protein